jgi:hypothetical protein
MQPPLIIAVAAGFAALPTLSGPAWAQANRTFVSGHGSDSNPCSLSAPCRSFAQALSQTNAGGEVTILDPGGYGAVTINKSISIVNDGVGEAGVTVTSGDAITVSTGASDVVNLRGLTLVGGGGQNGIVFGNLGALNIQNCVVRGFGNGITGQGITFVPVGTAALNVSDTIVSNASLDGIVVQPSGAGTVTAAFDRVQAIGNGGLGFSIDGSNSTGAVNVTIVNSLATNNHRSGVLAGSDVGKATTQMMISNSVMSNNSTGAEDAGTNSTTYLAKNTITGNTRAFFNNGVGALLSFGDNYIKGNGDDGGAIPLVSAK